MPCGVVPELRPASVTIVLLDEVSPTRKVPSSGSTTSVTEEAKAISWSSGLTGGPNGRNAENVQEISVAAAW